MQDYASLHNHSIFSILNSLTKPKDLFLRAKELGQSSIALTDYSLAGAWDALKASKETGVKLIIGCELNFVDDLSNKDEQIRHIILLAKNHQGYKNLLKILRLGYENHIVAFKKVMPRIDWSLLEQYNEGLICTTACCGGILGKLINNRKLEEAKVQAKRLKNIFNDNLAFEIQPHAMYRNQTNYNGYEDQTLVNRQLIKLGDELGVKVIAATDSHYLRKEQAKAHDVVCSIAAGVPIKYANRLKYDVPEFYMKSRQEVRDFFARHYKDRADEFCDNTLYFAEKCEFPEWIDPKFSNPVGNELPEFPVKDQPDYEEFRKWFESKIETDQKFADLDLKEDAGYLRYWCEKEFSKKVPFGKEIEYRARLDEELEVIDLKSFSSYLLVVADFINYCRNNNIITSVGRGCLTGDAEVLTKDGFKSLDAITTKDYVYTHTGQSSKVLDTFCYDVNETLLELKTGYSFKTVKLTHDHRVFAKKKDDKGPSWIKAKDINIGDYVCMPFPKKEKGSYPKVFDLLSLRNVSKQDLYSRFDLKNQISCRAIARKINKSFYFVHSIKNQTAVPLSCNIKYIKEIEDYLIDFGFNNINEWIKNKNYINYNIPRSIKLDKDLMYLMGRWVGDGSYHSRHGIVFSFNLNDKIGINKIKNILTKYNVHVCYEEISKTTSAKLTVCRKAIESLFRHIIPDYKNTPDTKHLPYFFRNLPRQILIELIQGIIDSDGYVKNNAAIITTTSRRLALEIKELLLLLKIKSSIFFEPCPKRYGVICKPSYRIRFRLPIVIDSKKYYFSKVTSINEAQASKVYDILVENDHSYLTSNFAVHNSCGGCLVAYLIGIHKADPIKYGLIFARFLNKEKTLSLDIDSDFSSEGKKLVEKYIINKYGADKVAHVSNLNTITPKVYARDIARSHQFGNDRKKAVEIGNHLADAIPDDVKSFSNILERAPLFAEYAKQEEYSVLKDYINDLSGLIRAMATHAGGNLISKRPLVDIVPTRVDADGTIAIEYEKERAEENGLIKIDILGLSTLDIIASTLNIIEKLGKPKPINYINYDKYDELSYNLISSGDTFCVFQLGTSAGTIDLCKKIKPKSITDIAIINALARPSAKEIRKDFIDVRNTGKQIELLHPKLERAFIKTFNTLGFGLYEESLMYLAQDIAGWNLHKADGLRKLTKDKGKNPEKAKKLKKEFIEDSMLNGIDKDIATRIWEEVVDGFQGYGFNFSHAIFYSMLGYQTAFLKAHYPLEFLIANLMSEDESNAKISAKNILTIKNEIRQRNINISAPNINKSKKVYNIIDDGNVITGLNSIKYMGKDAIPEILEKQPFSSFDDFMERIDARKVSIRSVQALIASGCFDDFITSRKQKFLYSSDYRKKLSVWKKRKNQNEPFNYPWPETEEWSAAEKYAMEVYYLGEGFSCPKRYAYSGFFDNRAVNFTQLPEFFPEGIEQDESHIGSNLGIIEGIIVDYFEFKVKKETSKIFGQMMGKIDLEDPYGNILSMTVFPMGLEKFHKRLKELGRGKIKLEPGIAIHCAASANWYEGDFGLVFEDLKNAVGIPALPKELGHQKVELKPSRKKKEKTSKVNPEEFLEEVEDELVDEGIFNDDDNDYEF